MDTFLGNVARCLYDELGDGISSARILLPNARSKLFFLDELGGLIRRPLWQPRYVTVDDLMCELSGFAPADRVRAVVELYKVYSRYHKETFDSFYFWGEMLLNDFDQIDKYLVDAEMLFSNLRDLKELEGDLGYFNEQQRAVIRRFWEAFGSEEAASGEKRDFLNIWCSLRTIYREFRERLADMGMAYAGMMYREAAGRLRRGEATVDDGHPVAVVGFNALSECEKVLFDHLRSACGARFFWDCDDYYVRDRHQEAGLFVRENLARYGQAPGFVNRTDNFGQAKEVAAVSVPSGALQCKYAADFLRSVIERQGYAGKETAIVLTDESLLVPLLHALPPEAGEVNVTMGYPLRQTLAYSFVARLLRLQTHTKTKGGTTAFYHADVTGILTHPFVMEADPEHAARLNGEIVARSRIYVKETDLACSPLLETLFRACGTWQEAAQWAIAVLSAVAGNGEGEEGRMRREYAGIIAETLRKLANSLEGCGVEMDIRVFASLARRMLQNMRVPYEGEPLRGIQVMGILETRNLDFCNVLILSMNDDNFPGSPAASSSFVPYGLRLGYGLPTPQHHDGVYAYYFYRLLQRAGRVDMVYSSRTDENSSGEPSRYIYQLEYESPHRVVHRQIGLDVGIASPEPIEVVKDAAVMRRLESWLGDEGEPLSPTALNTYLDCPLKFYFRYVAGLKPEDEVSEEVDMPMFGTILHKAMELLYEPLVGVASPADRIGALIGSETVTAAVERAVSEVYFHGEEVPRSEYEGNLLLVHDIVIRYINGNLLPFDSRLEGFSVSALEQRLTAPFAFGPEGRKTVTFSGLADRVDRLEGGRIRIVDYKTGTPHTDFVGVAALFGQAAAERNPAVLQTLLYSLMVTRMQAAGQMEGTDVCPSLYYVRLMNRPDYAPLLNLKDGRSITGYAPFREEFEACLGELLSEMFDEAVPFRQCEDAKPCAYCDFAPVCRRR